MENIFPNVEAVNLNYKMECTQFPNSFMSFTIKKQLLKIYVLYKRKGMNKVDKYFS